MRNSNTPFSSEHIPTSDGVLNKAAAGAHNVVIKVAGAADEAARRAIPAIDRAAEYAHETVDKAVTGVAPAAEWMNEHAASLNAAQKKFVSSTRDYVVAHPLKAIGIALAAGFLVSRFFRS